MKKPKYMTEIGGKYIEDKEFAVKMEKLAKAYKKWDDASSVCFNKCERYGYDHVYDNNGFEKQDKAMDILAKRFNACFGTDFDGETLACSKDLERAYFCAVNHGLLEGAE